MLTYKGKICGKCQRDHSCNDKSNNNTCTLQINKSGWNYFEDFEPYKKFVMDKSNNNTLQINKSGWNYFETYNKVYLICWKHKD